LRGVEVSRLASLPEGLLRRCQRNPEEIIAWHRQGEHFVSISAGDFAEKVRRRARGLQKLGVRKGDRVVLMAPNSVDWAILDFAILAIGALTVPLYPSLGIREIHYILGDCSPSLILLHNQEIYERLGAEGWGLPSERILLQETFGNLSSWNQLEAQGALEKEWVPPELDRNDLASIVYTSGTTGWPKGVMLRHGNFLSNLEGFLPLVPLVPGQRLLSILPLSHVFERATTHFAGYLLGLEVAYAERPDTVLRDLAQVHPDILIAVPRVFQLLYERLLRGLEDRPDWMGRFLRRGLGLAGSRPRAWQQFLSSRIVRRQLRKRLGGRLGYFVSGGAPLDPHIAQFFLDVGLPIVEGYGMTEASPVIAANPLSAIHPGTVGKPLPNLQLQIAADGEILVRGPSVMVGYWNNEQATREALVDGWLHTGDVGSLDSDGYLRVIERKKELIINSAGENIAPQKLEMRLCSQPLIAQAVVFGDRQPFLVALIYPNTEQVEKILGPHPNESELRRALQGAIQQALGDLPSFEQIRRFALLPEALSESTGTLTPTLKVRRKEVAKRYAHLLAQLQRS